VVWLGFPWGRTVTTFDAVKNKGLLIGIAVVVVIGLAAVSSYNGLVSLEQAVRAQWGQVENVYQRRADLVPNLVETVKGAAAFEKDTFTAVAEARSRVGQISAQGVEKLLSDPQAFQRFQQAQAELSSALSRLMAVSERYPDLKATAAFRDLQAQLEGTENRIAVARNRYIKAVESYNVTVRQFPSNLTAMAFGFKTKPNFSVENEREISKAPKLDFGQKGK